jgi:hypothetical protein
MKANIETVDGKVTLRVFYDPEVCNRHEAIAAGLASFGLKQGQAAVLALPFPNPVDTARAGRMRILGLNRDLSGEKAGGLVPAFYNKKTMARQLGTAQRRNYCSP